MVTVTSTRHNLAIRDFYIRLCRRDKPRKVVLVAAMRKLLLILKAVLRDQVPLAARAHAHGWRDLTFNTFSELIATHHS